MISKTTFLLGSIVSLHLALLALTQFTLWPEILSYPYLVSNGYKLYGDFIHPYPPLLTFVLTPLYQLFGFTPVVARFFAYFLVIVSDLLVYKLTLSLTKNARHSLGALVVYAILHTCLDGNMVWFDTVIVSSSLAALYFVLQSRYRWAGFFLALSIATKQTAGLMAVVTGGYILWQSKNRVKDLTHFLTFPALIGLVLVAILASQRVLHDMYLWVVEFPLTQWSEFPGYVEFHLATRDWLILGLLIAPLTLLCLRFKKQILLVFGFFLSALVMVYPRFSYFHLQLAVAILPILYALILTKTKHTKWFLVYGAIALLYIAKPTMMRLGNTEVRFATRGEYALAQEIHTFMQGRTGTVFLLGIDSSQYVYANILPPKPWVDNYGWYFEMPNVMDDVLARWENSPPGVVLRRPPFDGKWYALGTYEPKPLIAWLETHYVKTGHMHGTIEVWERKN